MKTFSAWHVVCSVLGIMLLFFSFCIVWLNITLVGLSYRIEDLQKTIAQETSLNDKLHLEQLNLVSARNMKQFMQRFNLQKPETDSIRKLRY